MTANEWIGIGIIAIAIIALVTSRLGFIVGVVALVGAVITGKASIFLAGYVLLMVAIFFFKAMPNSLVDSDKAKNEQEDLQFRNEQARYQRQFQQNSYFQEK